MTEEQYKKEHLAKLEDIKSKLTWIGFWIFWIGILKPFILQSYELWLKAGK